MCVCVYNILIHSQLNVFALPEWNKEGRYTHTHTHTHTHTQAEKGHWVKCPPIAQKFKAERCRKGL